MSKLSNDGFDNEVGINFCILQAIYVGLLAFPVPSNVFCMFCPLFRSWFVPEGDINMTLAWNLIVCDLWSFS